MANLAPHDAERELSHLRRLRDDVLEVLYDLRRTPRQKFEAIEFLFFEERDEESEGRDEEQGEEAHREPLS